MNKFDQFVKHQLKAKYYIRYADDFIILSPDKKWLEDLLLKISDFLWINLRLQLHPNKVSIQTIASGVDFLGWVNFTDHRILRTTTRRRMLKKILLKKMELENGLITKESFNQSMQSYSGMLKHCQGHRLEQELKKMASIPLD